MIVVLPMNLVAFILKNKYDSSYIELGTILKIWLLTP